MAPHLEQAKKRLLDAGVKAGRERLAIEQELRRTRPAVVPAPTRVDADAATQIHVSWDTHIACNYNCGYCFFHDRWDALKAGNRYRRPEEWQGFWDRFNDRFGSARIDIAGGEPFSYPGFFRILQHLTVRNYASISTNLSWRVDPVIRQIDPRKIVLSASFHPQYADRDEYLDKVIRLREAGFQITVNYVMWPPLWYRIPSDMAAFIERGIYCGAQPFRGTFWGLEFPRDYGPLAKQLLDEIISDQFWFRNIRDCPEYRALDAPNEDSAALVLKYQLGRESVRGSLCNTGRTYFRLQSNGLAMRCAQGDLIGDPFDESFSLWDSARPCPFQHCECINEMLYIEGGPRGPSPQPQHARPAAERPRVHLPVV